MPSTLAASYSSRARTAARSWPSSSARSLIDPFSPRDAQISTTRAPASASRASVPPHAIDSSSGCANTTRNVRPARSGALGLNDALIDGHVFVDHSTDAEAFHRPFANHTAVECEDPAEILDHLAEIAEDHAGHAVIDDLANSAKIQRNDRRPARHGFGEYETERLACLHRIHERPRAAEQLHLRVEIRFAVIDDLGAVDVRRDFLTIIVVLGGGQHQLHPDPLGHFDRLQHALALRESPEKEQVIVRRLLKREVVGVDPVQYRGDDVG